MQKDFENLVQMQEFSCKKNANQEIFGTKGPNGYRWITYKEFAEYVDYLRGGLHALGVQKGDKVAIIARNCVEWAVSAYATYGLRAHHVPMYESQNQEDWCYIIKDSGAKVLFAATTDIYEKLRPLVGEIPSLKHVINLELPSFKPVDKEILTNGHDSKSGDNVLTYRELLKKGQNHPFPSQYPEKDETLGLIYTSGTTGFPKGVILSHGNILSNLFALPELISLANDDRSMSFLPWAHIFGQVAEVHCLIYAGFSTGLAENVSSIIENLAEIRPTLIFSVPRIFNKIYDGVHAKMNDRGGVIKRLFDQGMVLASKRRENGPLNLGEKIMLGFIDRLVFKKVRDRFGGRLKYAISGASALNLEVAKFIDNLGIIVLEGYGLSETSPLVTVNTMTKRRLGSVGPVIPEVRVVIDRKVLGEGHQGEDGEIVVYGPNVMKGYHNLPEETQKVMTKDGGFRTGDLGRFDADGFLYITGRIKEQYKLENGKYVVPNIMEDAFKLSPFITQAFIYGSNKPYNVALIVVDTGQVEKWAKANSLSPLGNELLRHREINDLIFKEIKDFSKGFKEYERPKKISLLMEDWTVENGLITPTMKVKRNAIYDRFKNIIENLYQ